MAGRRIGFEHIGHGVKGHCSIKKARHLRNVRQAACGDDTHIRFYRAHKRPVQRSVEPNLYVESSQLPNIIFYTFHDLRASRGHRGESSHASCLTTFFQNRDLVATKRRHSGDCQTCRACTNDEDPSGCGHILVLKKIFSPHFRVHDTGSFFEGQGPLNTPLAASDAWPDICETAFIGLLGKFWISQMGPPHGNHVGSTFSDDTIGQLRILDPADCYDRNRYGPFYCFGQMDEAGMIRIH